MATHSPRSLLKRFVIIALFLAGTSPATAWAQSLPKEGGGSSTAYYTGAFKTLEAGKDHVSSSYEVLGIVVNDAGQGFLHNAAVRCLGGLQSVKGDYGLPQPGPSSVPRQMLIGRRFFRPVRR